MSTLKSFKLVPEKVFFDMVNRLGDKKCQAGDSSNQNDANRSLSQIQENNLKEYNINNNKNVQDLFSASNSLVKSGKGEVSSPFLVTSDISKIPKYSDSIKLQKSANSLEQILNLNIDPQLKSKLFDIFRQKYSDTKMSNIISSYRKEHDTKSTDKVITFNHKWSIIEDISSNQVTTFKERNVISLGKVMMKFSKFIDWNEYGDITYPPGIRSASLHLESLIDMLLTENYLGTNRKITTICTLIRPFYTKLKSYVQNKRVLQYMSQWGELKHTKGNYIFF